MCLSDLVSVPLASSPVESPALTDHPIESSADLLHGDIGIRTMAEDNIHILKLKSLEGISESLNDMLAGEAS